MIAGFCDREQLPPLDPSAMAKVIEFASRLSNHQDKLSTRFGEITQIVGEAGTWAKLEKSKVVTAELIQKTLQEREDRLQKYNERYLEMIQDRTLLIDTSGSKVGQING